MLAWTCYCVLVLAARVSKGCWQNREEPREVWGMGERTGAGETRVVVWYPAVTATTGDDKQ